MKGYAFIKVGQADWIEKEKPVAGVNDAIIRPLAVAPCTSDVHNVFIGGFVKSNSIIGHEAVGEVVEVGSGVRDFKPGDRVVVPSITPDWNTLENQNGHHQHCGGLFGGFKLSSVWDGVFGELFKVNDADMNLAHLPEGVSLDNALMAVDMMTTGFYGAEAAEIEYGSTVVVFGIGPIGLMAIAGSALHGAGRIIAVGSRPACIEAAKFYGATDIINYRNGDVHEQIMKITDGKGADSAVVAGGDATDTIVTALQTTKIGATISNICTFMTGDTLQIPLPTWSFGLPAKKITGNLCPGGRLRMEKLLELIKHKRIDPSKLISHTFYGMDNIPKAFHLMHEKPADLIKPIVILE